MFMTNERKNKGQSATVESRCSVLGCNVFSPVMYHILGLLQCSSCFCKTKFIIQ